MGILTEINAITRGVIIHWSRESLAGRRVFLLTVAVVILFLCSGPILSIFTENEKLKRNVQLVLCIIVLILLVAEPIVDSIAKSRS